MKLLQIIANPVLYKVRASGTRARVRGPSFLPTGAVSFRPPSCPFVIVWNSMLSYYKRCLKQLKSVFRVILRIYCYLQVSSEL